MDLRIDLGDGQTTSAKLLRPGDSRALFVYAHGAGAPYTHSFMEASAQAFADQGIASLRFNFGYAEAGSRRPDRQPRLVAEIDAVVRRAIELADGLPVFGGGKSMGGRMASHASLHELGVRGLIFVGFPLHPPKKPATARAAHLPVLPLPMLFLQGDRDALADLDLMRQVCRDLGGRATLHVCRGADHGFSVLKRSGRTPEEVLEELADTARTWIESVLGD